jgi:hypothetical protein
MARPRGSKVSKAQQVRLATGAGMMIGYIRVSTQGQGTNGHSLDGQRTRLEDTAAREGFVLVDVVSEVESGAKERGRPARYRVTMHRREPSGRRPRSWNSRPPSRSQGYAPMPMPGPCGASKGCYAHL